MLSFLCSARRAIGNCTKKKREGQGIAAPADHKQTLFLPAWQSRARCTLTGFRGSLYNTALDNRYCSGRFSDFGPAADVGRPLHSDGLARELHPDSPVDCRRGQIPIRCGVFRRFVIMIIGWKKQSKNRMLSPDAHCNGYTAKQPSLTAAPQNGAAKAF